MSERSSAVWTDRLSAKDFTVVCICLVCIVFSAILFAVYPINHDVLYVAVTFGAVGLGLALIYVIYKCISSSPEKSKWCRQTAGDRCCEKCMRTFLCLDANVRATRRTRRDRRRQPPPAEVRDIIDTPAEFRGLEREIQCLSREYTRLEPLAVDREYLRHDMSQVQGDYILVCQWIEGLRVPTWEDIQNMKSRLAILERRCQREDGRQRQAASGGSAFSIAYPRPSFSNNAFCEVAILDPLQPPPYQETDPNTPAVHSNVSQADGVAFPAGSGFMPPPAYLGRSQTSLAPPADDFNAPPSYEEASSTTL